MHFDTGRFHLTGYGKPGRSRRLWVYIEGDGRAFVNRRQPSSDPTPNHPLALQLALADPAEAVVYLARPCQYTTPNTQEGCAVRIWTVCRFSEAVCQALDRAVDQAKQRFSARRVGLVGYSGGGVLAVLLSVRRQDVDAVITVASPLDHHAWTTLHRVTPLMCSLDPMAVASDSARIPQVHFAGERDTIVPIGVIASFTGRQPPNSHGRLVSVPGLNHRSGWAEIWPQLLQRYRSSLLPAP